MALIELTHQGTAGSPSRPVLINTEHVASVKPLRNLVPSENSQYGHVESKDIGTEIIMNDGTTHRVVNSFNDVYHVLEVTHPEDTPAVEEAEDIIAFDQAVAEDEGNSVPLEDLDAVIAAAANDVPEPEPTPEPEPAPEPVAETPAPKKAPAKKAAPKAAPSAPAE